MGPRPACWVQSDGPALVTREGFSYSAYLVSDLKQQVTYSWLSLPDNEVNFNTGTHHFDSDINASEPNATASYQVTFAKPYKTVPATPAIWCITLQYTGGANTERNGRLRGRVENLTKTGFSLVIESWGGSRHSGNVWGWCVWDKEFDGVKVKTATHSFTNKELTKGNINHWEPDFDLPEGKRPLSIMTGIRGFDIDVGDGGHFHLKSQFQGSLDNGAIEYGSDATTQSRWVEAMYVAILEN
ncbi:hypothetical protein EsH8_III_000172 [Colletotrichum jinshuiense]